MRGRTAAERWTHRRAEKNPRGATRAPTDGAALSAAWRRGRHPPAQRRGAAPGGAHVLRVAGLRLSTHSEHDERSDVQFPGIWEDCVVPRLVYPRIETVLA